MATIHTKPKKSSNRKTGKSRISKPLPKHCRCACCCAYPNTKRILVHHSGICLQPGCIIQPRNGSLFKVSDDTGSFGSKQTQDQGADNLGYRTGDISNASEKKDNESSGDKVPRLVCHAFECPCKCCDHKPLWKYNLDADPFYDFYTANLLGLVLLRRILPNKLDIQEEVW